jgi:acyl-CoA thioesterase-1
MLRTTLVLCLWLASLPVLAGNRIIMVLGDSLSAGYGIPVQQGWVHLLEERLASSGRDFTVINASISGDTTAGALARLDHLLARMTPAVTIVELGANDGLRGLPLEEITANLSGIITRLQSTGVRVLLLPMQLPPNYGHAYNDKFIKIYSDLAVRHDITLGKFILEHIADHPELMQSDNIHPVAGAQRQMLDNIWPDVAALLPP